MSTEDNCIVCAEPLAFIAYGACGHKETCSRCVARLRSVLQDKRCAYCREEHNEVFVTRYAGDYTRQINTGDFPKLKNRLHAGELYYLPSAQAYFDDKLHFEEISALCSFTHPLAGSNRTFPSLRAIKNHIQNAYKRQFCDICLEGRKVFICEQLAYTKGELDRHLRQGDLEGELAASGFKGHPECKFCKKRFYGETEIFNHMHSGHEECFLCRRAAPHRHVYYRDYADLENHFHQAHHPCTHPACLEQKFVVFATEQELKTHMAREHKESLSKMERKQALAIDVGFSYRRGSDRDSLPPSNSASNLAAVAMSGQRAVVIGGAASVPAQFGGAGGGRRSRGNLAAAGVDSLEQQHMSDAQTATVIDREQQRPDSNASSAPDITPLTLRETDFPSMVAPNPAAGAGSSSGRWANAAGSSQQGLRAEDFPALPGTSKSAKRRAAKKKSAADVVGGRGGVRIVSGGGLNSTSRLEFPLLGAHPLPRDRLAEEETRYSVSADRPRRNMQRIPSTQEVAEPTPQAQPCRRPPSAAAAALPPRPPSSSNNTEKTSGGGISEALRTANRELVEKIKTRLADSTKFATFRKQSAAWVKGNITSRTYHDAIASLGLVSLVPELAATCPDEKKKDELLSVHATAFDTRDAGAPNGSWMPPEAAAAAVAQAATNSSWTCGVCTLVNAPVAKTCEACGHPKSISSDSTSNTRPSSNNRNTMASIIARGSGGSSSQPVARADEFPALGEPLRRMPSQGDNGASTSNAAGPSSNRKKEKQSLQTFMKSTKVHTQNPWKNPSLKGEWASAGAGAYAQEQRALNDAWGKK